MNMLYNLSLRTQEQQHVYSSISSEVFRSRPATMLNKDSIASLFLKILQFSEKLFYRTPVNYCFYFYFDRMIISNTPLLISNRPNTCIGLCPNFAVWYSLSPELKSLLLNYTLSLQNLSNKLLPNEFSKA